MKRYLKPGLIALAIFAAVLIGIVIGDKRSPFQQWRDLLAGRANDFPKLDPNDPALQASLPQPDLAAGLPPSPLNELLKPDLTPQQQTDIIGQMLIDYWTTTRTLPHGEWSEICEQLAGKNREKLALVPAGHPALGKNGFVSGPDQPGIRLHILSSTGAAFQLIYDGPDGKPYSDDDLIRNFPP